MYSKTSKSVFACSFSAPSPPFCPGGNLEMELDPGGPRVGWAWPAGDSGGRGPAVQLRGAGGQGWIQPKGAQCVSHSPNLVDVFLQLLKVTSHAVIHSRETWAEFYCASQEAGLSLLFRTKRDSTIYMCEIVRIILPSVVFKNHLGPWFLNPDTRRSAGFP